MITGKIRSWPQGTNYANRFCQIYLNVSDELLIFNGYMDSVYISRFNELVQDFSGIEIINMSTKDSRKSTQEALDNWSKSKGLVAYHKPEIFLTQLKLNLISNKENENE